MGTIIEKTKMKHLPVRDRNYTNIGETILSTEPRVADFIDLEGITIVYENQTDPSKRASVYIGISDRESHIVAKHNQGYLGLTDNPETEKRSINGFKYHSHFQAGQFGAVGSWLRIDMDRADARYVSHPSEGTLCRIDLTSNRGSLEFGLLSNHNHDKMKDGIIIHPDVNEPKIYMPGAFTWAHHLPIQPMLAIYAPR